MSNYLKSLVLVEIAAAANVYCVAEYPTLLDTYDKRVLKARMMQEMRAR